MVNGVPFHIPVILQITKDQNQFVLRPEKLVVDHSIQELQPVVKRDTTVDTILPTITNVLKKKRKKK